MIIGYFLFDSGGVPLVQEQFVGLLKSDRTPLFTSLITAIGKAMEQILAQRPRHIELESLHIYFAFSENFIFALIVDIEYEDYLIIAKKVVDEVEKLGLSPEDINVNAVAKDTVRRIIRRIIVLRFPSANELVELAKMILSFSDLLPIDPSKDFEIIIPKSREIEPKSFSPKRGSVNIKDVIEHAFNGDFQHALEESQKLFNSEYSDLAKAIYARVGLLLNMYDPNVKAPELNKVLWVIDKIEDRVLRDALKSELDLFLRMVPSRTAFDVYLANQDLIDSTIRTGNFRSMIYEFVFNPIPWKPFLEYIVDKYGDKHEFFVSLAREMLAIMDIFSRPPKNLEEWMRFYSNAKLEFEEALKSKSEFLEHKYLIFLLSIIWGLFVPGLSEEDGYKIINHYITYIEKHQRELGELSRRVLVTHKIFSIMALYNILVRILYESLETEDKKDLVSRLESKVRDLIKYANRVYREGRVPHIYFLALLVGLLSLYTRLIVDTEKAPKVVIDNILSLIPQNIDDSKKINPILYTHYYINMLDILGNLASLIEIDTIRTNMLRRVAHLLESIAKSLGKSEVYAYMAFLFATRLYGIAKDNKAEALIKELRNIYSPFLISILKQTK